MNRVLFVLLAAALGLTAGWLAWSPRIGAPAGAESPASESKAATTERSDPVAAEAAALEARDAGVDREPVERARREVLSDDLVVRVVDTKQQPVPELPVVLSHEPRVAAPTADSHRLRRTDAGGRAVFTGGRRLLQQGDDPWYLVHCVPFAEQPHVRLDEKTLAHDVVISVQPPFGAIDVVVSDRDGNPATGLEQVSLSPIDPRETEDPSLAFRRPRFDLPFDGSHRVRFAFVELGREWVAGAYRPASNTPSTGRGPGPRYPSQILEIPITVDLDHPVAVFRAVDSRGEPLRETGLKVAVRAFGTASSRDLLTDQQGRFAIDESAFAFFGQSLSVECDLAGEHLVGASPIPHHRSPGRHDCGDLVLRAAGVLVAGRVVDESGAPVPGHRVRAGTDVSYEAGSDTHGYHWDAFGSPKREAITDAAGRFTILDVLPAQEFKVWVDGDRLRSDPVDARPGVTNLLLSCYAVYATTVRVQLPPGMASEGLDLRLLHAGTASEAARISSSHAEGDVVRVAMGRVRAGLYDLTFGLRGQTLGTRPGIRAQADGEIAAIDLRQMLHDHSVTLRGPEGSTSDLTGVLLWRPVDGSVDWRKVDFDFKASDRAAPANPPDEDVGDGVVRFATAAPAVDVRILARACHPSELRGLRDAQSVQLRAGARVRLVLRTTGRIPAVPYTFAPVPMVDGHYVGQAIGSPYFTDTRREAVFVVPAGRIEIGWHLEHHVGNGSISSNVLDQHNVVIFVRDTPSEQTFELPLEGAALTGIEQKVGW